MLMALDADPGVEAVASQPMWLHWVSESGKARRHAPDFFVHRADGTGVLIDVRPDNRVSDPNSAVFAATAVMAGQASWSYDRLGELLAVRAANLRWLAGYRHPRSGRSTRHREHEPEGQRQHHLCIGPPAPASLVHWAS